MGTNVLILKNKPMFKRCTVVMLPTNEKANIDKGQIYLKSHKKGNIDDSLVNSKLCIASKYLDYDDRQNIIFCAGGDIYLKSQNLYLLSDDEIKEGDWCVEFHLDWTPKEVFQCKRSIPGECIVRKIIATTDTFLKWSNDNEIQIIDYHFTQLPQPSQSFIEKYISEYNKGNIIREVMVEYEAIGNWRHAEFVYTQDIPKVSKDNTITIKKVKDSWNREEVLLFAEKYARMVQEKEIQLNGYKLIHNQKWIEENL